MESTDENKPQATKMPTRRLTKFQKMLKTCLGAVLFIGWISLFILGISLEATTFRAYIIPADEICWNYLALYAVSLTPINVAVLASLSGALGGIASNLAANTKFSVIDPSTLKPNSTDFQSYLYMTESPLVSLLRGFITFMIFIAGSYLTNFTTSIDTKNTAEFAGLTASTYTRFAVTVSLLAYLAGYDPSRIKSLLNSFNLAKKENEATNVEKEDYIKRVIDIHISSQAVKSPLSSKVLDASSNGQHAAAG